MDVCPICHVYKSMKFMKRLKRTFLFFKLEFSNFVANRRYESYGKIQNFSSISLKLCLLGQKNTATETLTQHIRLLLHYSLTGIHLTRWAQMS